MSSSDLLSLDVNRSMKLVTFGLHFFLFNKLNCCVLNIFEYSKHVFVVLTA